MSPFVTTRDGRRVVLHTRTAADRPYEGEIEGLSGVFTWDSCGNIDEVSLDHSPLDLAEDVWSSGSKGEVR